MQKDSFHRTGLRVLNEEWSNCTKCEIGCHATNHVLYSSFPGNQHTVDIVFIGEGPGRSEDALGKTFIGPSGRILRQSIYEANVDRYTIGLTNLVACRPYDENGDNRAPTPEEVHNCSPRLEEYIQLVKPKIVVAVGRVAYDCLPASLEKINYAGRLMTVKHPAYILRCGIRSSQKMQFDEQIKNIFRTLRLL